MTTEMGWAFAIGAGRHLDYRVILAPDFLVRSREYGFLGDVARPTEPGQPAQLLPVTTPAGRQLTIGCASQSLLTSDIADSTHPATVNDAVRDEQNRPLRLIFGVAIDKQCVGTMDRSDMETARAVALGAYRDFLTREDEFTVVPSTAYPLHSVLGPVDHLAPTTIGGRPATSAAERPANPIGPERHGPGNRRITGVLLGLIALVIVAVLVALVLRGTTNTPTCPTTVTTDGTGATISGAAPTSTTTTCP